MKHEEHEGHEEPQQGKRGLGAWSRGVFEFREELILHRSVARRADAPVRPRTLAVDVLADARVQDGDLADRVFVAIPLARELEEAASGVDAAVVREAAALEDK